MSGPRHEIPTHLNVEDKAFFGLSVRQVMVLTVGLSTAYGLWTGWPGLSSALRAALAVVALTLALVLALVRPHGRGLEEWLFVVLHYLRTPRVAVWRPREPHHDAWDRGESAWAETAPHVAWKEDPR
ncbi:MAG TPA: PrgI family protein [Chloroflexota bacterium]|nr:PrgI family protein [Chloroflexota bacterium]